VSAIGRRRCASVAVVAAAAFLGSCHSQLRFDDATCVADGDCGIAGLHCLGGACVACASDVHCTTAGLPRCDLALHRCVECGVSSDCPNNQSCRGGRCITACGIGIACPATAPRCDDGFCGQCDDGVGCPGPASHCVGHLCVGCLRDADCGGATPRCDAVRRACVQCQANADCPTATPICDPTAGLCLAGQ
jgi:hypothetical protein